ncbi:type VII secretion target [Actinocorallia sp. B10E7]|uniref:type VII secretion target n=1 Tax=Actinocorallia sp. B10E7 TaxID=3153558 RepID=UPI00325F1042
MSPQDGFAVRYEAMQTASEHVGNAAQQWTAAVTALGGGQFQPLSLGILGKGVVSGYNAVVTGSQKTLRDGATSVKGVSTKLKESSAKYKENDYLGPI